MVFHDQEEPDADRATMRERRRLQTVSMETKNKRRTITNVALTTQ